MGGKGKVDGAGPGGGGGAPGGSKPGRVLRKSTPESRREAVEAYRKSGLTQQAFARSWGVNAVTLGGWLRAYEEGGPKALEPKGRRGGARLPAAVRDEVVAVQRRFPDFGLKKIGHFLARFAGLRVSATSVRRIRRAEGLPATAVPVKRKRKPAPPRRFERSRPGELWQSDITYLDVAWQRGPLYLIAFLDDFSRYVVGHGVFTHQRGEIAVDVFVEACARFGKPKEVLTDQGRQYYAWRGKTEFQRLLAREGVAHVVARAHHPMTVGKTERFWETLKRELWDRVHPKDLEEARARVAHFVAHHNHQRPHQSLEGLVPADRFFGAEREVRAAVEAAIGKNELRLALGEAPRKPVYLVGQIDGRTVSVHGEAGKVVVQTADGVRQEIEAKDLGAIPGRKEACDERTEQQRERGGAEDDPDGDGADGAGEEAAHGAQAHEVRGAGEDAVAGAGAVGGGDAAGAGGGAPGGDGGAAGVAGQGEP